MNKSSIYKGRGRNHMAVVFTTTMQSVSITTEVVSSNPVQAQLYSIQHYVIVCQCLAAGRWFSPGTPVSFNNKTYCCYITEILLKVALKTI